MNIEKIECEKLGNEYKSLLEQICYYLDYKPYISKANIDKIRDLALKLETGEYEIIQFKRTLCKFDVDEKIKEEVEKKEQEKDKEIERLNNIIDELEKALDENVELTYVHNGKRQYNKILTEGGLLFRDYIKSKLQELKGDVNSEKKK